MCAVGGYSRAEAETVFNNWLRDASCKLDSDREVVDFLVKHAYVLVVVFAPLCVQHLSHFV